MMRDLPPGPTPHWSEQPTYPPRRPVWPLVAVLGVLVVLGVVAAAVVL